MWLSYVVPRACGVVSYVAEVSERLKRLLSKHNIVVHFKPQNILRQRLFSLSAEHNTDIPDSRIKFT